MNSYLIFTEYGLYEYAGKHTALEVTKYFNLVKKCKEVQVVPYKDWDYRLKVIQTYLEKCLQLEYIK